MGQSSIQSVSCKQPMMARNHLGEGGCEEPATDLQVCGGNSSAGPKAAVACFPAGFGPCTGANGCAGELRGLNDLTGAEGPKGFARGTTAIRVWAGAYKSP
jgi:hypothetical protein